MEYYWKVTFYFFLRIRSNGSGKRCLSAVDICVAYHHWIKIWQNICRYNTLHLANWSVEVVDVIHTYQAQVIDEVTQRDYDGEDIPSKNRKFCFIHFWNHTISESPWNFSGALLYSITVITTIGKRREQIMFWPWFISVPQTTISVLFYTRNLWVCGCNNFMTVRQQYFI